jgi:hypothetical protein
MSIETEWENVIAWFESIFHHAHAGTLPPAPVVGGPPVALPPVNPAVITPPAPVLPVVVPVVPAPVPVVDDITITGGCYGHSAKVDAYIAARLLTQPGATLPKEILFEGMLGHLSGDALIEAEFQLDNMYPFIPGEVFDSSRDSWGPRFVTVIDSKIVLVGPNGEVGARADILVFGRAYKTAEQVIAYMSTLLYKSSAFGGGFVAHP